MRRRGWRSSREQSGKLQSRTVTLWKLAGLRRCPTVLLERQQCFTTKAVIGKHARLVIGAAAVTSLAHQYDNGRAAVVPEMYMMTAKFCVYSAMSVCCLQSPEDYSHTRPPSERAAGFVALLEWQSIAFEHPFQHCI